MHQLHRCGSKDQLNASLELVQKHAKSNMSAHAIDAQELKRNIESCNDPNDSHESEAHYPDSDLNLSLAS